MGGMPLPFPRPLPRTLPLPPRPPLPGNVWPRDDPLEAPRPRLLLPLAMIYGYTRCDDQSRVGKNTRSRAIYSEMQKRAAVSLSGEYNPEQTSHWLANGRQ